MNPVSVTLASKIISDTQKLLKSTPAEVVIAAPYPFMHLLGAKSRSKIKLAAEDVSVEKKVGAFTGEVSAEMLKSMGASYCIVGHSERRARGEAAGMVATKASNLLAAKISPIICIGEKERREGGEHWQVISDELRASLAGISRAQASNCIIAYEPIWAVGKNSKGVMEPDAISESAIFIKKILAEMFGTNIAAKIRIIYGGSVDAKSAEGIALATGVSGVLVGRASLAPAQFAKIIGSFS